MKATFSTFLSATLLLASGAVSAGIIDFDDYAAGTVIDDEYSSLGLTVTANSNGAFNLAMIFDSSNPTGGDSDLVTPGYGFNNNQALSSILIISEDGDGTDPDDEAKGGTITFDFDSEVIMQSLGILDIDKDEGNGVELFDMGGSLGYFAFAALGDNSFQEIDFGDLTITKMVVEFSSSGAITDLEFTSVPEPAVMSLLGAGLIGLGFFGRRRKMQ